MGARTLLTINTKLTDTHALDTTNNWPWPYPLGSQFEETPDVGTNRDPGTTPSLRGRGQRKWLFVYNDSGTAFAAGDVIARKAGEQQFYARVAPVGTHQGLLMGVAAHAIPTGEAGWIVCEGLVEARADDTTAIAANQNLVLGTGGVDGRLMAGGATAANVGWAVEAATAGNLGLCYVAFRV
jgi:predicted RecA/RadA family phage recombinase